MMSTTDLGFQSGYSKLSTSRSSLRLTNPSPLAQVNRNLLTPSPGSFRTFSSSSSTGTYVLLIFLPVRASYSSTIALNPMLCGRLVICAARKYRIIGFPTQLRGKYERNYFRFNLCFVFDRSADLSCYEPVVRKVSRVLTNCEEESAFLSSPESSFKIHAILEQLYEDLNSYSESSISLDRFNSIELKIFPFYPNPPAVMDWTVPLALINLEKIIEPNWDLTMAKVCQYIDGINHVSRIAHLAECDVELTRQAISHLLFYQVIMTIDIFQYSNMYTLRKSIQWLADEAHVKEECGAYVAKPGRMHADWPKLLRLYSRLKPGTTVFEWMQEHDVRDMGIDVRRFTSFGVIKGFLRRVHRWPILLADEAQKSKGDPSPGPPSPSARQRSISLSGSPHLHTPTPASPSGIPRMRRRPSDVSSATPLVSVSPTAALSNSTTSMSTGPPQLPFAPRKSSATASLEQLQTRNGGAMLGPRTPSTASKSFFPSPLTSHSRGARNFRARGEGGAGTATADGRRHSLISPASLYEVANALAKNSASQNSAPGIDSAERKCRGSAFSTLSTGANTRPRLSRSPSSPAMAQQQQQQQQGSTALLSVSFPPELVDLLDGEHHTDELCTKFEVGWPTMEHWLAAIGGGKGEGDLGKVLIVYR